MLISVGTLPTIVTFLYHLHHSRNSTYFGPPDTDLYHGPLKFSPNGTSIHQSLPPPTGRMGVLDTLGLPLHKWHAGPADRPACSWCAATRPNESANETALYGNQTRGQSVDESGWVFLHCYRWQPSRCFASGSLPRWTGCCSLDVDGHGKLASRQQGIVDDHFVRRSMLSNSTCRANLRQGDNTWSPDAKCRVCLHCASLDGQPAVGIADGLW